MMDWIITGASRGIGRALARALAEGATRKDRLFLLARDLLLLNELTAELQGRLRVFPLSVDLSLQAAARAAGEQLADKVRPGSVLVHNAGVWPSRRELVDGFERAYATNCLCPLALQQPLLDADCLSRVLVVSAGLLVKGRFDAEQTPTGGDFGAIHTYCASKLAGAVAMRDAARHHPHVDFAVVHPGVVRTDLGNRRGVLGALLRLVKRGWESPEVCAARLVRLLNQPRWQRIAGEAPWLVEENEQPWPVAAERDAGEIRRALERSAFEPIPDAARISARSARSRP